MTDENIFLNGNRTNVIRLLREYTSGEGLGGSYPLGNPFFMKYNLRQKVMIATKKGHNLKPKNHSQKHSGYTTGPFGLRLKATVQFKFSYKILS